MLPGNKIRLGQAFWQDTTSLELAFSIHLDEYPVANVLNVRYINAMDVKTINHLLA
jgi:hypothetical protein